MPSLLVLPSVGSNVTVHITRVHLKSHCSLVEFGGSFNHGQLTEEIYDQMKKDIQIPKERDCDFEGNPGDVCLVEEDRTWHRARILSKSGNSYSVFLFDEGRSFWVSNTVLARGQSSFFNLPPLMEFFILANVFPLSENSWSPTASEFLQCLCGKSVSGCVQDIMDNRIILLDVPSVFKDMHQLGFARVIPTEKFKSLVTGYLNSPQDLNIANCSYGSTVVKTMAIGNTGICDQYFHPELLPTFIESVEVTHVVNPLKIFCRLHVFGLELKKLSKQINEHYEGTSISVMERPLSTGSPCATKGNDGKWYRSVLQQNLISDHAKVFHVDYGKVEFVTVVNIRPLSAIFFRLPVVTYACSMNGIMDNGNGWTTSQVEKLKLLVENQILVGHFEHQCMSENYVTLFGGKNININYTFAIEENCLSKTGMADLSHSVQLQKSITDCCELGKVIQDQSVDEDHISKYHEKTMLSGQFNTESHTRTKNNVKLELSSGKENNLPPEHLFTLGSVVNLNVTCIEDDHVFWCQLVSCVPSLQTLMNKLQSYYSHSQPQLPTGSLCVARHPENKLWYRAHITGQLTTNVDIRLIDYGKLINRVPLNDLRPITPELLQLKCQAFQCSLSNRISTLNFSKTDDALISESGCNTPLKCTICAIMYDSQGRVLNLVDVHSSSSNENPLVTNKLNCLPAKSLPTSILLNQTCAILPLDLNVGAKEKVRITCVKDVNHFYGQLERNEQIIYKISKDIQHFCVKGKHEMYRFSPQMMCLARYNDQWHRGQIISINSQIIVHFVDYGDVLALDKSEVLPFPAKLGDLMSIPFQAMHFKLFNVALEDSLKFNNWFDTLITDQTFNATIMEKKPTGHLSVELHDGKTNINLLVMRKWMEIHKKEPISRRNVNMTLVENGELLKEKACTTGFSQENLNLSRSPGMVESSFINEKHVHVDLCKEQNEDKKTSNSKLAELPERILNADFVAEVYVSHCNNLSSFYIHLAEEECNILLLGEKLNSSQLSHLPADLSQLFPGDLVNAEYPVDGAWYRAVVQNKLEDGTVEVEFIDFGNKATLPVLKVCQMDSEFLKFPRYSIHCALITDDEHNKPWTTEQVDKFMEATSDKKLICHFIEEISSVWRVKIKDQHAIFPEVMEMELTPMLNSSSFPLTQVAVYKKPEVCLGEKIEVYASSVVGPDHFWCQYANTENLDRIGQMVQELGNSDQTDLIQIDDLSPGDPCIALFPDDKIWHRAQVIEKSTTSVSVLFVDYGNESDICQNEIKAIPAILLESPPQAFLCQLEGFLSKHGSWNSEASSTFFRQVVDNLLEVQILNVEETLCYHNCSKYHLMVKCKAVVINDLMKEHWDNSLLENCGKDSNRSSNSTEGTVSTSDGFI